mgnify:CR=1 FL=1
MKYKILSYKTADDINIAERTFFRLQNKFNHVRVVLANALTIVIEYSK